MQNLILLNQSVFAKEKGHGLETEKFLFALAAVCVALGPPTTDRRSASWSRPWRFAARRLGLALGDSPLGVSVSPLAIRRSASRSRAQRGTLAANIPLG